MSAGISSSSCGRTSERGMNPGQAACPTARGPHLEAGGISLPGSPSPTHPGQVPRSAPLSTGGSAPIPQCFLPPSLRQTLTLGRPPSPVQVLFPRRCPERPSVCWPQKSPVLRGRVQCFTVTTTLAGVFTQMLLIGVRKPSPNPNFLGVSVIRGCQALSDATFYIY